MLAHRVGVLSFRTIWKRALTLQPPTPLLSGVYALVTLSMGEAVISHTGEIRAACRPLVSVLYGVLRSWSRPHACSLTWTTSTALTWAPSLPIPVRRVVGQPGYTWRLSVSTLQTSSVEAGIHPAGLNKGLCSRTPPPPPPPWAGLEVYTQRQLTIKKPMVMT